MSTVITYPKDVAARVRIAPLDPDAIKQVRVDCTGWLEGGTLDAHAWTVASPIVQGDGLTSKTIGTGESITPAASVAAAGVVTAYVWSDGTGVLGQDYVITLTLRSASKADDRSFIFRLAER